MFLFNRTERKLIAIRDSIIIPDTVGFSNGNLTNNVIDKKHLGQVLRYAICFSLVLAIVGVVVLQNLGVFAPKNMSINNSTSVKSVVTKNSFTLVAYAATNSLDASESSSSVVPGGAASSAVDSLSSSDGVNVATRTVLQPNVKITLPVGKITRNYNGVTSYMQGVKIYAYTFPIDSVFKIEGNDIDSIILTSKLGTLFSLGKDPYAIPQSMYSPGNPATITPNNFIRWHLNYSDQYNILTNPNFTDFTSIPPDTVTIEVKFKDGTTQTRTVDIAFNNDGSLSSTLSE
jgi:hypothetical protein